MMRPDTSNWCLFDNPDYAGDEIFCNSCGSEEDLVFENDNEEEALCQECWSSTRASGEDEEDDDDIPLQAA